MPSAKLSVTLEEDLVTEARRVAGARGLSGYVNQALRMQLQRDRLSTLLADLEREFGPIDPAHQDEVNRSWPKPSGDRRSD